MEVDDLQCGEPHGISQDDADADGNQKIDLQELRSAIALWYLHTTRQVEQKQKAESAWYFCCCGQRTTMEKYEYPGALSDADETNQP